MSTKFDEEMEPLFLAYGLACYTAQNLESTLRMLLVVSRSRSEGEAISKIAIEEIERDTAKEAIFALFQRAIKAEYFTSKEESIVKAAMRKRNYLIHEFWNARIMKINTPQGRAEIESELYTLRKEIKKADKIVVALIDEVMSEYGLTTELFKQLADQLYEEGELRPDGAIH